MAAIRSLSDISKKWADVTPQRAPQYEAGVRSPKKSWKERTLAASDSYKAGVTEAIAKNRFSSGVTRAGDEKWKRGAIEKGTARFGPGVQVAKPDYERGFGPYREVIAATTLPPRYARRDPRNIERVKAIVTALGSAKMAAGK